jgi:hypothetical protein
MVNIIITSVIAGIHKTKVGSHPTIKLLVEDDNSIPDTDPNCMLVRLPYIEDIPPSLRSLVTYPKSRNPRDSRQSDQFAFQVAGKKVGNVPANLCGLLRKLKTDRKVKGVHWFVLYIVFCFATKILDYPKIVKMWLK